MVSAIKKKIKSPIIEMTLLKIKAVNISLSEKLFFNKKNNTNSRTPTPAGAPGVTNPTNQATTKDPITRKISQFKKSYLGFNMFKTPIKSKDEIVKNTK
jgi:hypothetical protein